MLQNRKLLAALALAGALGFQGCTLPKMIKLAKQQQLTVTPNPLEVHADKVDFSMSALLPVKMLKKGTTYTVNNTYKYGDKRVDVGSVTFNAADYPNAKKEQPKVEKTFSFPYAEGMEQRGELVVQGVAAKGKKSKTTPELTVATGLITTSRLVREVSTQVYADHGYNSGPEYTPVNVGFYFQKGRSELRSTETKSRRGKFLDAFIAAKNATKTVTVTGTHSPEGAETVNTNLSQQRAQSIEKYYRGKMKQYDYRKQADSVEFVLKPVIQDWTMFRDTLAANTSLTQAQKDEILSAIGTGGTFVEQERQLKTLRSYNTLVRDVYPKLRTAMTEILTLKEKKTDAEISALSRKIAGGGDVNQLSNEELAYSATLTPDLNERKSIYEAAVRKSDSWSTHNNLAAVHLEMANKETDQARRQQLADQALTHLQMAKNQGDHAEVYANMAAAYSIKGMRTEAADAINKAGNLTGNEETSRAVAGARGVILIREGKYNEAITALSSGGQSGDVLYNKGLAQVLAKQYDAALSTFTDAEAAMPNDAWNYYVAAIAGARLKNESVMNTNLQKAISMNADLRAKALTDLEFNSYANSEGFKNAVR